MKTHLLPARLPRGFSLVITITLMVLLSLIAVGLLSLSSVTLRSSANELDRYEARANARLALQMALGQLQATMGVDQAVTASAETLHPAPQQPHLLGSWRSWSWDPILERQAPDYQAEKRQRFQGWLASQRQAPGAAPNIDYPTAPPLNATVPLVSQGSFGTVSGQAPLVGELVPVSRDGSVTSGNLAWTVLPEDTKARINLHRDDSRPSDNRHLAASLTFPERFAQEPFDLAGYQPATEQEWTRLISDKSLDAAVGSGGAASLAKEHFFNFTTYSRGVLSDVSEGGLKQDLTTILENELLDGTRVYSRSDTPFGVADPHWSYLSDYYNQYQQFQGASTNPIDVTANIPPQNRLNVNDSSPASLTLKPVVAKLQILFSMVSHLNSSLDLNGTTAGYNAEDPGYAGQHLRPWLVFEPIVTLWNPYSVPIEFDGLAIGLDKIPVAFRFAKDTGGRAGQADLRAPDPQNGNRNNRSFWPLSQFVWGGSKDDAITNFSFNIRGGTMEDGITRDSILLQPGENKVFTSLVREGTSWSQVRNNFSIQSSGTVGSTSNNSKVKNIDFVEGWNTMAGFRLDHLARFRDQRNSASLYSFEQRAFTAPSSTRIKQDWFHICVLRPQDSIVVKAKLSNNDANTDSEEERRDDFTMLVEMDRTNGISTNQILGSSFTVREKDGLREEGAEEIIERTFPVITILQSERDTTRGGKTPFAVFTMTAKSSNELLSPTKGWLFGNPVLTAYQQDETEAPQPVQSYEFSFREVTSTNSFPMVEIDPQTNRGYFGSGQGALNGLTAAPMFALPTTPMVSLGQFQAANLISGVRPPFFNYPFGNSHAHPMLAPNEAVNGTFVDHSYLLNQRLWDRFYFSGLSRLGDTDNKAALTNFFARQATLTPRLQPYLQGSSQADELVEELSADPLTASREMAAYQMLEGPFNIHSTSVNAWKSVLMSAFEVAVPTRDGEQLQVAQATPYSRFLPTYSEQLNDLASAAGSGDVGGEAIQRAERWLGFHKLTEAQVEVLAQEIVAQIRLRCQEDRGPFLSFAEFVNRRIGPAGDRFTNKGVLQTAIDLANDPQGNSSQPGIGSQGELFSLEDGVGIQGIDPRILNQEALVGNTAEGSPATLLQGDILQHLGSVLTVRSDTFRIRAYGSSVAKNGQEQAEAWCEAIVQRVPEFIDSSQSPGSEVASLNPVNANFGRRFKMVSFRWLARDEV